MSHSAHHMRGMADYCKWLVSICLDHTPAECQGNGFGYFSMSALGIDEASFTTPPPPQNK